MKEKAKKKGTKSKANRKLFVYSCPHCHKNFDNSSNWHSHVKLHSTEEPYHCDLCDYKCKVQKYLSRHVKKVHTKPTGHQCPVCGKCFHFDCNLRDHMRVHTGEKPYKCNVCDKAFNSRYSLSGHKLIHTGEKPFQCEYCDYACRDNSTIRRHIERHLGISKDYPCSICKKNFKKKTTLQMHVDEVHFELETRKHPCEQCDKVFKTKGALSIHVKTVHKKTNRIKCEICGRLSSKNNLQAHMRRHIDVKPYKCSYKPCGKRFKDKGDLKCHIKIHYPENQHVCTGCNRRFPRKYRLTRHLLNGCRVQCHYCGQLFSAKIYLAQHIKNAHGPYPKSREYLCDICDMVTYSRRGIIQHLKYGHGTEKDTKCQICKKDYFKYQTLKEHYLSHHNLQYSLLDKKKQAKVAIKDEPLEEIEEMGDPPEFMYEVEIQKHDIDDTPQETSLITLQPTCPEYITIDTLQPTSPENFTIDSDTITYSKKVLSEDISRSLIERDSINDVFDDFFIGNVLKKPEKELQPPKQIVDEVKKKRVEKRLEKLLVQARVRNQWVVLEKLRRQYNRRIKTAYSGRVKKDQKSIRYFKKPENKANHDKDTHTDDDKINNEETDDFNKQKNDSQKENSENINLNDEIGEDRMIDDEIADGNGDGIINDEETADKNRDDITNDEIGEDRMIDDEIADGNGDGIINDEETADKNRDDITNDEIGEDRMINDEIADGNGDGIINDEEIADKNRDDITNYEEIADNNGDELLNGHDDDEKDLDYKDFEGNSDEETNPNGKLKFNTHQCYICFKLFKTKTDLKIHSKQHFDICNEKMLKKCPFCGYVTDLTITRHIKLVHKISLDIPYGRIKERDTQNGSKYVFEIDKNCDLEVIPSISNLNKIASMKIDEKNRKSKNIFLGTTKLVRKGGDWMVEKQKVDINNEYLLPEFCEEDYQALKSIGDNYLEQIRSLSIIAKKKGLKILYPCEGCDKICLTMSALKLHSRKHEANPKRFKPKVWKNKILIGLNGRYSQVNKKNNRKKYGGNNNSVVTNQNDGKNNPEKKYRKLERIGKQENKPEEVAHRFADPNPVKNNHKCDRELIEFYHNNIKGGDIEFWQFLKIFNKMTRENVNDFKDLENRFDFGMHNIVNHDEITNGNTIESNKEEDMIEETQVIKKRGKKKKKGFTRVIMISKKEYLRRLEIKNQMRQRIERSKT